MMFTFMLLVLLYIFSQFFAIIGLINLDIANIKMPIPITIYEVTTAYQLLMCSTKLCKRIFECSFLYFAAFRSRCTNFVCFYCRSPP